MRLEIEGRERVFEPAVLVVIGYAGRDRAAVEAHIDELAELGVPRPASIPLYMTFPPWLISQEPSITVAGLHTSGEAELVVVVDGGDMFVTLGSDHTDRVLEAVDIVASKGICPKPVANTAWAASSIGDRWDDLTLRSSIDGGVRYQDGPVAANLPPLELVEAIPWSQEPPRCFVAFTGTVPVIGGIRPSASFHGELASPALDPIGFGYRVDPVAALNG